MRRTGLALALICTALVAAAPAAAAGRAPATVRLAECQPGGDSGTRLGAFEAAMRRVPGTHLMQVRFYLLERRGDGRFARVEAPGLGVWRSSRAGVRRFVYTQRIAGLKAQADYKVVVHHRWVGRDGKRLRFARRHSGVCEIAGVLPDLRVVKISNRHWVEDGERYSVVVRNAGGVPARDVTVLLSVDGVALPALTLKSLGARRTRSIRFYGPPCLSTLSVTVDPEDSVREADERDNVRVLACHGS